MASSANRIYYAVQAVQMESVNGPGIDGASLEGTSGFKSVFGVQSVGISTNFNLENVFQLGEFDQYDVLDDNPEIEVTLNKVIDYTNPLYVLACGGSSVTTTGKNVLELAPRRCNVRLFVGSDLDNQNVTGTLGYVVKMTGMYLSSITYTFATDGNFTEEATLVGNNKVWYNNSDSLTSNAGANQVIPGSGTIGFDNLRATGIARRWNIDMTTSVLPTGTTSWDGGIVSPHNGTNFIVPHITNLTVSCDLGREPLYQLGSRAPYTRFVNVPLEVTSEFEVIGTEHDVSASDFLKSNACAANTRNLQPREIYLRLCGPTANDTAKGINFYLGKNNRLTSVNYSGGDTGGGNVTVTYSFTGYNTFYVDQGAALTVTNAPYNGRGHNVCGRTASNVATGDVTFGTTTTANQTGSTA
jgi:hypothetical protein